MSGEFIIFQKVADNGNYASSMSVTLSADHDSRVAYATPYEVHINLAMGNVSPVVVVRFMDAMGSIMSRGDIGINEPFYLEISSNSTTMSRAAIIPLRLSDILYGNSSNNNNGSGQIEYKLTFMFDRWADFITNEKNRCWLGKTYSDVIKEISDSYGFYTTVEPSIGAQESIIQPYYTDSQMLRYCIERADTQTGDMLLVAPRIFQNRLDIQSKTTFINDQSGQASNGNCPVLTMGPKPTDEKQYRQDVLDNGDFPTTFTIFDSSSDLVAYQKSAAVGVKSYTYDFETAEYTPMDDSFESESTTTVSKYKYDAPVAEAHFECATTKTQNIINKNRVNSDILNFRRFTVATDGCEWFEVGMVVELVIPSSPYSGVDAVYSESDSGFYIITGIDHRMNFGRVNTYTTLLTLRREGVDSSDSSYKQGNRFI